MTVVFQRKIKWWKIFYTTTEREGNTLEDWSDTPTSGVQAVLFEYDDGPPEVFHNRDWYAMKENQHGLRFECDQTGNRVDFPDTCEPSDVKMGEWIEKPKFLAIVKRAQIERDAL